MRRLAVAVGAVAVFAGGSAVAFGAIPGGSGRIDACYNNGDGTVRVIDTEKSPPGTCGKGWTAFNWSQTGPQGAPGVKGDKGDTGPQGPPGPATITYTDGFSIVYQPFSGSDPQAKCQPGDVALSAGTDDPGSLSIKGIAPITPVKSTVPIGFTFRVVNNSSVEQTLNAWIICQRTDTSAG